MHESGPPLRILFLGDTGFGETYQRREAERGRTNVLAEHGYDYSLRKLAPLLQGRDLVVANLETPLTKPGPSPLDGRKKYVHRDDPELAPAALRRHGIDVVSLGNNHALDYGAAGLSPTLDALHRHGIAAIGAGGHAEAAAGPYRRMFDLDGEMLSLIICAGKHKRREASYPYYATPDEAGVNAWTSRTAADQIARARATDPDALLVAYPHWGLNYQWRTGAQSRLARVLVDAGADVVIGHGAHMVQEIERYRGRWILYSLGNFVFNSPGRYRKRKGAIPYSLAAVMNIERRAGRPFARLHLYPILSDNRETGYQPRTVSDVEAALVRDEIIKRSPESDALGEVLRCERDDRGSRLSLDLGPMAWRPSMQRPVTVTPGQRPTLQESIGLAAQFLVGASEPDGRFTYRVNLDPDVRVPPRYNLLRHAGTMYALAMFQSRQPDPVVADVLERSRRFLVERCIAPVAECEDALAVWSDPAITMSTSDHQAKLGGAGIGLVALAAAEHVAPSSTPIETLQGLGRFIRFMQKDDGSFHSKYIPTRGGRQDRWTSLYYPGEAALGLVMLHELDGHPAWLQCAADAISYLARLREGRVVVPADHWALLATARLLPRLQPRGSTVSREAILGHAVQVCESIMREQVWSAPDRGLIGGYTPDGRTTPTSTRLEGLIAALTFLPAEDEERRQRLRASIEEGLKFLRPAQVLGGPFAGGYPRATRPASSGDARRDRRFNRRVGEIRIDYVQHAMCAMMQFAEIADSSRTKPWRSAG
ncbi:MAG: CapA family protein [Planctomycetota bacterium]|jgi:poly-gamma-glutamate capsule biosynthesis protein CapA/YwtB (metallophosphatase superfamily)